MKSILYIIKKELKRFFTDRRMLVGIILPGLLIYLVYSVMGVTMTDMLTDTEFNIYIENYPEELNDFLSQDNYKFNVLENMTEEEIMNGLKEKTIDCYIAFEEGFIDKVNNYDISSGEKAPSVEIYYNSSNDNSQSFYNLFTNYLNYYESTITNKFDINNSNNIYDLATKEDISVMLISMMLPFLLITFLFSGTMSISSESIAGEKERGTIATLLITPVKRSYIVIGKLVALALTSLVSSVVSFVSILLSIPNLLGGDVTLEMYGTGSIILLFIVIAVTVLLFTTLITIISTYSKSVKEASSLCVPLMVIIMLIGATGFMQTSAVDNKALYLIPVYNSLQCFRGLLSLNMEPLSLGITIISNVAFISVGVFILSKMFNNEKIMFNK